MIHDMSRATTDRQPALQWIGWTASCLVLLALTSPWAIWILASPMYEFSFKFNGHVFFPPDGPEDRFQYFQNLVIARGQRVNYATCVLCSITVQGLIYQRATALWGDVTVENGGAVGQGIEVNGGSITLLAGSWVTPPPLSAIGGSVIIESGVKTYPAFAISHPRFFYPGQRSWPASGVAIFVLFVLLASACGGWLLSGSLRERVENAVRRPLRIALSIVLLFALLLALLFLAALSLYFFPPLAFFLYFFIPIAYWLALAIGLAVVAEWLGSLLGRGNRLGARLTGAALLTALMLVPVIGLFVMGAVMLVALGTGGCVLPLQRVGMRRASLSSH